MSLSDLGRSLFSAHIGDGVAGAGTPTSSNHRVLTPRSLSPGPRRQLSRGPSVAALATPPLPPKPVGTGTGTPRAATPSGVVSVSALASLCTLLGAPPPPDPARAPYTPASLVAVLRAALDEAISIEGRTSSSSVGAWRVGQPPPLPVIHPTPGRPALGPPVVPCAVL